MSACGVMVARDSADIVEAVVRHSLWHLDDMICTDHRSIDGTREILDQLPVDLYELEGRGFDVELIWTWLAIKAYAKGHDWMVVVDDDDVWHVEADRDERVADFLELLPDTTRVVGASSFNHVPTSIDDPLEANPARRIGWRRINADARKVACRLRSDLTYGQHNAWYSGECWPPQDRLFTIRHFTIRSADQLVDKVRTGLDSSSVEAGMPPGHDYGWQNQWGNATDDEIRTRFYAEFWSDDPEAEWSLVYDPAPLKEA